MSIQSEIERLTQAKREIRQAIQDKGVEVPEGTPFRQYAEKIGEISAMTQEQADARYLQLAGGTMTGPLYLSADPTQEMEAVTKKYADSAGLKIATGSYVGTNISGKDNPNTLTFPSTPYLLFIVSGRYMAVMIRGSDSYPALNWSSVQNSGTCTWGDKSVSWWAYEILAQFNQKIPYKYLALLQ